MPIPFHLLRNTAPASSCYISHHGMPLPHLSHDALLALSTRAPCSKLVKPQSPGKCLIHALPGSNCQVMTDNTLFLDK